MKIQDWIVKNKWAIIIGLVIFIALIKLNIIPSSFTAQTFSIFGGASITLTIGIILLAIGIICMFVPGGQFIGILFSIGAFLIAGSGVILGIEQLFKTATGWIMLGVIFLVLYILKR
jgi:hypothetical protein